MLGPGQSSVCFVLAEEEWEPLCHRYQKMCWRRWQSTRKERRAALAPQQWDSPLMEGTTKGTSLWRWLWEWDSQRGQVWGSPVQGGTLQS